MKFGKWRTKKLVEEIKELLKLKSSNLVEQEEESTEEKIAKRKKRLKELEKRYDKVWDAQVDLEFEMKDNPELEAKYGGLYDEMEEELSALSGDIEDMEDEIKDLEAGKVPYSERPDDEKAAPGEEPPEEPEQKKEAEPETEEIKSKKEQIESIKQSIDYNKKVLSDPDKSDSQKESAKESIDKWSSKLKEVEKELEDLFKRHKEATGQ